MKIKLVIAGIIVAANLGTPSGMAAGRDDDFDAIVKIIEQFYHVKHENIPLLARVGMKGAKTAARIRGGEARRLAEAGSVRVAFFEDQQFNSRGEIARFKSALQNRLNETWSLLIATLSTKDEEQTYIYLRDAGAKFHVLVLTIERSEATLVQATIAPSVLAELMKDPGDMGKAIADDAATSDP